MHKVQKIFSATMQGPGCIDDYTLKLGESPKTADEMPLKSRALHATIRPSFLKSPPTKPEIRNRCIQRAKEYRLNCDLAFDVASEIWATVLAEKMVDDGKINIYFTENKSSILANANQIITLSDNIEVNNCLFYYLLKRFDNLAISLGMLLEQNSIDFIEYIPQDLP